ncbi:CHAD domain-containing protein [bacterium]|nr:CHAD domain-containing protein [bacterium]
MLKTMIAVDEIPQDLLLPVRQDDSIGCVCRKILAGQLSIVLNHQENALHRDDPEALHEVRMAVRRMRTCLRVMEPYIGEDIVNRLLPGMKKTGSTLGKVRDIDSFIIWLSKIREYLHFKVRVAIDAIENKYVEVRNQKQQMVIDELEGESYQDWMQALLEYLHTEFDAESASKSLHVEAPNMLGYLLSYVRATTKDASAASFKKLHKLRVRCKWLRYFCEFFNDAYGGNLKPVIKEIKALQSELGIVQDHTRDIKLLKANQNELANELVCVDEKSITAVIQFLTRHRRNTRKRFKKIWKDFAAKPNQKHLKRKFGDFPAIAETPAQSPSD